MLTTVYFVRHAEPNYANHNDHERELTPKGLADTPKVTAFFVDKTIDALYSSPYLRAIDTIKDLANSKELSIHTIEGFRERQVDSVWIDDFDTFVKQQWDDFSYKLSDGESLSQVQERNIKALNNLLDKHRGQSLVIGSHGTALSNVINYYQPGFGLSKFNAIKHLFPFIVKFTFSHQSCQSITLYDILKEPIHETPLL